MSYTPDTPARLQADAAQIIARYPDGYSRSTLPPVLHLVQSVDDYVSSDGIGFISAILDLPHVEINTITTFYMQYEHHPIGEYLAGVCTNALYAVMGDGEVWKKASEKVGVRDDEASEDDKIMLGRIECNVACDYASVVMINWELFDNQSPESMLAMIGNIQIGRDIHPTRDPVAAPIFEKNERVLAGFLGDYGNGGPSAGRATLLGHEIAIANDWIESIAAEIADGVTDTKGEDVKRVPHMSRPDR